MKQPWQLLGEIPGDDPEAIERVRSIVAQAGVADGVADQVTRDLAGSAAASVSYRVFVPAGRNSTGGGTQDWAFFLVTQPRYGYDPDAPERWGVVQVFLYPAVLRDANAVPESRTPN